MLFAGCVGVAVCVVVLLGAGFIGYDIAYQKQRQIRVYAIIEQSHLLKKQHDEKLDQQLSDLRQRCIEYLTKRTKIDEESGITGSVAVARALIDMNQVPLQVERKDV